MDRQQGLKGEHYAPDELIVRFKPSAISDSKSREKVIAHAHNAVGAKVKRNYDRRGLPGTQVVKLSSGKSVDEAITSTWRTRTCSM